MKKKKTKKQPGIVESLEKDNDEQVIIGIRISKLDRQRLKIYAAQQGTTITELIREYISSLVGNR